MGDIRVKTWLGRLVLVLVAPAVFFAGVEGVLRVVGYGRETGFFIEDGDSSSFRTNPRYTELFFPASFGLKPLNFRIPFDKPPGTIRVFVVGESAAMGVPEPGFGLAPLMEAQLRAVLPDHTVNVYNLGVTAINSHVVRHIVSQAVRFKPDLIAIYMGNNEMVGPFSPGGPTTAGMPPLWFIRASFWVRATRVGQLLEALLNGIRKPGAGFREWRGMETFADKILRADDPRLDGVYSSFDDNLRDILRMVEDAGVPAVVSTVAVNVGDSSPFASLHHDRLAATELDRWRDVFDRGRWELGKADPLEASRLLLEASELSPRHADTHFFLARAMAGKQSSESARLHFLEALRWDCLRFRADERINSIIREAVGNSGDAVKLADAAESMGSAETSTEPPAGFRYFFEHVHLNWTGNYRLARLLSEAALGTLSGLDPADVRWLSPAECSAVVGYTEPGRLMTLLSMADLTRRPPFTNQLAFGEAQHRLNREIEAATAMVSRPGAIEAAVETVESSLERDPDNGFLLFHAAALHAQQGNFRRALSLNARLDAVQPSSPETSVQRAYLLQQLGRQREAEEILLETARSSPYYFQTYALLGNLWGSDDRLAEALRAFADYALKMPESLTVQNTFARLLAEAGNWEAAEVQWRRVLAIAPDDEAALAPLVQRLRSRGADDEAVDLMRQAFSYNPKSYENDLRLARHFRSVNDTRQVVEVMKAAIESGRASVTEYLELADLLEKVERPGEALARLFQARDIALEGNAEALVREIDELIAARQ